MVVEFASDGFAEGICPGLPLFTCFIDLEHGVAVAVGRWGADLRRDSPCCGDGSPVVQLNGAVVGVGNYGWPSKCVVRQRGGAVR